MNDTVKFHKLCNGVSTLCGMCSVFTTVSCYFKPGKCSRRSPGKKNVALDLYVWMLMEKCNDDHQCCVLWLYQLSGKVSASKCFQQQKS